MISRGKSLRLLGIFLACTSIAMAAGPELELARKLYNLTDFDQSLRTLQAIPQKDASVYELMGRDYYMLADYKKATEALEKAVAADPVSSDCALWLGRAYGRRAETSNPFSAPMQASKARQFFERAVQLDPRNLDALNDLFDYYLEAPGFLGGGADKAAATASQISTISQAEGYAAQAKLAEHHKQFGSAEQQLNRAIEAAPQQIGKIIELARLLAKQGRYQESDQTVARADKIAPNSPRLLYAKADLYIQTGRHLDVARTLLERYLTCALTPDDPPRSDAEKLLRKARGV
jgi:tetratricopeptide (TPR) repeat protein